MGKTNHWNDPRSDFYVKGFRANEEWKGLSSRRSMKYHQMQGPSRNPQLESGSNYSRRLMDQTARDLDYSRVVVPQMIMIIYNKTVLQAAKL